MENESIRKKIRRSNIVYFNGLTVKDRNFKTTFTSFSTTGIDDKVRIDFYDENNKILSLKSKY
jgi:hypothetical protein